jgi:hypothetical protein
MIPLENGDTFRSETNKQLIHTSNNFNQVGKDLTAEKLE